MIACFAIVCVVTLAWLHALDTRNRYTPTRRQIRRWRRDRLVLATDNRRRP